VNTFVVAWLVGEGIVSYRYVKQVGSPPVPGALLATSGLFIMLALLAEAPKARFLASALAWGFDSAAFLNLFVNPPKAGQTVAAGLPLPSPAQAGQSALQAAHSAATAAGGLIQRQVTSGPTGTTNPK
jgi:hypothetical protein